jgi:hypothetical protein
MAFMNTPEFRKTGQALFGFLPDLQPGDNRTGLFVEPLEAIECAGSSRCGNVAQCNCSERCNCLPKKAFPGYPSAMIADAGAIMQSQ